MAALAFLILFSINAFGSTNQNADCQPLPVQSQAEDAFTASCLNVCTYFLENESDFTKEEKDGERKSLRNRCQNIAADQKLRDSITGRSALIAKDVRWLTMRVYRALLGKPSQPSLISRFSWPAPFGKKCGKITPKDNAGLKVQDHPNQASFANASETLNANAPSRADSFITNG